MSQLVSLRDERQAFEANDTEIIGVSVDPAEGEKGQIAFAKSLGLDFSLLPDTERKLSMLYGAAQRQTDLSARMSVLIDKKGIVRWIDRKVNVRTHGSDVLNKMRELGMAK